MRNVKKQNKGYTIIETMIAISIFTIVVTIGIGSLLNANLVHQKSQDMRSIIDSLSFVMEDISSNLRTGYNYRCVTNLGQYGGTADGQNCFGIAFQPAGVPSDPRWVYEVVSQGDIAYIRKSTNGGANWVQLTPNEVKINTLESNFSVSGAPPPPDNKQPFVTIKLVGTITYQNVVSPFSLQTSVSQRLIDVQ
ncbi:MAG: prepilin-type N-terminal cleavage/methylation domain-containing protein [Candidatus Paceibacterota bacterium]